MRDDEPRPVWMSLLITHLGPVMRETIKLFFYFYFKFPVVFVGNLGLEVQVGALQEFAVPSWPHLACPSTIRPSIAVRALLLLCCFCPLSGTSAFVLSMSQASVRCGELACQKDSYLRSLSAVRVANIPRSLSYSKLV